MVLLLKSQFSQNYVFSNGGQDISAISTLIDFEIFNIGSPHYYLRIFGSFFLKNAFFLRYLVLHLLHLILKSLKFKYLNKKAFFKEKLPTIRR